MTSLGLVLMVLAVGVVLYLVNRYVPMASSLKTVLPVDVVVFVCMWLLRATGLWTHLAKFRIG